jgi:hypothetical protein
MMDGFANYLLNEILYRTIGRFFKATGFVGAVYLVIAVGLGLFIWSKSVQALGDLGAALSCTAVAVVLMSLFTFVHGRLFTKAS